MAVSPQVESQRVAADLRAQIASGQLAPGDALPSESEIMETYAIGKSTVAKVLGILRAEGLIESHRGKGSFVRQRGYVVRHGQDRFDRRHRLVGKAPFRAEVENQGRTPRVDVVGIDVVEVPQWVAEKLALRLGSQVLRRRNIYFVDDEPVQVVITYLDADLAVGTPLAQPVPGPGGIYDALEQLGLRMARVQEDVTARLASYDETQELKLSMGSPVLEVKNVIYDDNDQPFAASLFIFNGWRNRLSYEFPVS